MLEKWWRYKIIFFLHKMKNGNLAKRLNEFSSNLPGSQSIVKRDKGAGESSRPFNSFQLTSHRFSKVIGRTQLYTRGSHVNLEWSFQALEGIYCDQAFFILSYWEVKFSNNFSRFTKFRAGGSGHNFVDNSNLSMLTVASRKMAWFCS